MITLRHIPMMLMTGCLLTACQNDETRENGPKTDGHPILFSTVDVSPGTMTRTGAADTYDSQLPEGSSIGVYIYYDSENNNDSYLTGTIGNSSGQTATWVYKTGAPYAAGGDLYRSQLSLTSHKFTPSFPTKGGNNFYTDVEIFAVFPNNESYTPTPISYSDNIPPTATSYTVTVPLDQTGSDATNIADIKAADLMTTDGMVTFTKEQCIDRKEMVNLVLKHRMAKVTVVFQPKAGSDLTAANMPTKFDVIGVRRELTVTPSTGTVDLNSSAAATTESSPLKGSTTQSFFIPPQTLASGTRLLKFNILGSGTFRGIQGASFSLPAAQNFAAGTHYTITVTLDVDHVTQTGTITSWSNGGDVPFTAYDDGML